MLCRLARLRFPGSVLSEVRCEVVFANIHSSTTSNALGRHFHEVQTELERLGKARCLCNVECPTSVIQLHDGDAKAGVDLFSTAANSPQRSGVRRARRNHFENFVLCESERFAILALGNVRNGDTNKGSIVFRQVAETHFTRDFPAKRILVHPLESRMPTFKRLIDEAALNTKRWRTVRLSFGAKCLWSNLEQTLSGQVK